MIIPYSQVDGAWTLPDEVLAGLWTKAESQGLPNRTFKDLSVKSMSDFFIMMKSPANLPCLCVEDDKAVAVAWVNGVGKGYGFIHYFFFKEYWGRVREYAEEILSYWYNLEWDEKPVFNVLLGLTPPENKLGLKLTKKMGFTILGEIPLVGVVSYQERTLWAQKAAATPAQPTHKHS